MKKLLLLIALCAPLTFVDAQTTELKYYDPNADAIKDVNLAVNKASESNKHVLLQIGGNWCKWCRLYDKWSHETTKIDSLIKADYVVVHVNFSPENKNSELMKKLEYPQRFGFPVIVILDKKGNRIHTQNTGYLEEGEGYSEKKVEEFLKSWNVNAFNEINYK
jgi:thioredoxin-related protein